MDSSATPKPRGRKRSSPAAPKKSCLLPTPAAKRINVESPSKEFRAVAGYVPFVNDFNGYKCQFLTREFQFILKFFGEQVLFTKTESLAVFAMTEYYRQVCETSIQSLLTPWSTDDVTIVNPFSLDASGNFKKMFIRVSPTCTYYYKQGSQPAVECSKVGRHVQGSTFTARVAVIIKGIKYSADGTKVSPIMHVCQVLEHEPLVKTLAADAVNSTCILDDDYPSSTVATLAEADTDELDPEDEAAFLAYIEAENRRLDAETDSAYSSNN